MGLNGQRTRRRPGYGRFHAGVLSDSAYEYVIYVALLPHTYPSYVHNPQVKAPSKDPFLQAVQALLQLYYYGVPTQTVRPE